VFSEAELDRLPEAIRFHLRTAIAPGTPLATSGRLRMRGQLKLGRWLPFRAEQVLAPHHGFHWAASVAGRFGVGWTAADDRHVTATLCLDGVEVDLHYVLEDDGRISWVVLDRWGDSDRTESWGWYPFGGEVTGYRTFGGVTVPSVGRVGWFYGTDRWSQGEFFRFQLSALELSAPLG
jgi:hypothetical protein